MVATSTLSSYQGTSNSIYYQATSTSSSTVITNLITNLIYLGLADQNQMQAQAQSLYLARQVDQYQPFVPEAPHIIQEREVARAARERDERERAVTRSLANQRAEELLLAHLTPAQRESIRANGWFIVEGGKSKLQYRVSPRSYAGNITQLDNGVPRSRFCCHVGTHIPVADNALAQKLMLEVDEDEFLRLANRTAA